MLTFDQSSAELMAANRTIAAAIKTQHDAQDPFAVHIITAYTAGAAGDTDSQAAFVTAYDAWRTANVALVAPIASALAHPVPGAPSTDGTIFGNGPAPAAPIPAAAPAPVPQPAPMPAAATPAPGSAGYSTGAPPTAPAKRSRAAWTHPEVGKLVRALVGTNPADPAQTEPALAAFATASAGKFDVEAVRAKAIELELVAAPAPPAAPYELTADEQASIGEAILEWIAPVEFPAEVRLAKLRYAATAIREFVKGIAGT